MFDIVIKNGWVIDGTGATKFKGTVGVKDGVISCVSHINGNHVNGGETFEIIDAEGKVVCPGFIDIHSHGDYTVFKRPFSPDKVWQGITTQTIGHCGHSLAPLPKDTHALKLLGIESEKREWETFAEYLSIIAQGNLGTNVAPFVGYTPVRLAVLGVSDKKPNKNELKQMCRLLEEVMDAGAFGFTTGLAYPPQCHAMTEELIALCKVVARYDGIYATHVRDILYNTASGVREAIEIGKRSGVRVHIAHLQIRPNPSHTLQEVLNLMDKARSRGIEVTCDQYPYLGGQGPLTPLFPAWALSGSNEDIKARMHDERKRTGIKTYMQEVVEQYFKWSDIILWGGVNEHLRGQSIQTLAHLLEKDPRDVVMDLLMEYGVSFTALVFGKSQEDLHSAAVWTHAAVGTDGRFYDENMYNHPRTFGTFPRMIRKYVREEKSLSLEECIRRMTGLPAQILRLANRGIISKGKKADILILDPDNINDTATYQNPVAKAEGIQYVIVNGKIVKALDEDRKAPTGEVLHLV